jgi:hypothetical protein
MFALNMGQIIWFTGKITHGGAKDVFENFSL